MNQDPRPLVRFVDWYNETIPERSWRTFHAYVLAPTLIYAGLFKLKGPLGLVVAGLGFFEIAYHSGKLQTLDQ